MIMAISLREAAGGSNRAASTPLPNPASREIWKIRTGAFRKQGEAITHYSTFSLLQKNLILKNFAVLFSSLLQKKPDSFGPFDLAFSSNL